MQKSLLRIAGPNKVQKRSVKGLRLQTSFAVCTWSIVFPFLCADGGVNTSNKNPNEIMEVWRCIISIYGNQFHLLLERLESKSESGSERGLATIDTRESRRPRFSLTKQKCWTTLTTTIPSTTPECNNSNTSNHTTNHPLN
jgi:hypothetical protein